MKNNSLSINKLLEEFSEFVADADIKSARILSNISVAIFKKRMEMNMSQKAFAEYMDVSQSMISKWESGTYNFTIDTLIRICSKLDLNFDVRIGKSEITPFRNFISNQWSIQGSIGSKNIPERVIA
ncbi:MAG TPA: helix-turn-helix transcriptional regulator [Firmicutes bacterium]|nr:helix-turn-helix transcriptional regulator [Bacillota bacterium]